MTRNHDQAAESIAVVVVVFAVVATAYFWKKEPRQGEGSGKKRLPNGRFSELSRGPPDGWYYSTVPPAAWGPHAAHLAVLSRVGSVKRVAASCVLTMVRLQSLYDVTP